MPRLMEKRDLIQTMADVGSADDIWFENVVGDARTVSLSYGGSLPGDFCETEWSTPSAVIFDQPRQQKDLAEGSGSSRRSKIE